MSSVITNDRDLNFVGAGTNGCVYFSKNRSKVYKLTLPTEVRHEIKMSKALKKVDPLGIHSIVDIVDKHAPPSVIRELQRDCEAKGEVDFLGDVPLFIAQSNGGISLTKAVPALSSDQIKVVLHSLVDACATFHAAGISHNDIKPDNIVIDNSGHARLIDYGLSIELDDMSHDKINYTFPYFVFSPIQYALADSAMSLPSNLRMKWRDSTLQFLNTLPDAKTRLYDRLF